MTDPTGHRECEFDGNCAPPPSSKPNSPANLISFSGANGQTWTDAEKATVNKGANDLTNAIAQTTNKNRWAAAKLGVGTYSRISSADAFFAVYGGAVTFYKTGTECAEGCFGKWSGNNTINVYNNIYQKDGAGNYDFSKSRIPNESTANRWAVHELGHGFEAKVNTILGDNHIRNNLPVAVANRDGFAGPAYGWQQSECAINCNGEIFADMVVGWTYGQWDTGEYIADARAKANYMSTNMSVWIGVVSP